MDRTLLVPRVFIWSMLKTQKTINDVLLFQRGSVMSKNFFLDMMRESLAHKRFVLKQQIYKVCRMRLLIFCSHIVIENPKIGTFTKFSLPNQKNVTSKSCKCHLNSCQTMSHDGVRMSNGSDVGLEWEHVWNNAFYTINNMIVQFGRLNIK